jgi:hypothetical protein
LFHTGAFFAAAKNRAFRSNLFYRFTVKKDFHCNPLRARGLAALFYYTAAAASLSPALHAGRAENFPLHESSVTVKDSAHNKEE